ncbi:hypothetical protein F5887DRAFT_1281201 [Amanita rubescens]|nr:hypothetical protein F5887DRAFT_1281201 [Amanita rubescens]
MALELEPVSASSTTGWMLRLTFRKRNPQRWDSSPTLTILSFTILGSMISAGIFINIQKEQNLKNFKSSSSEDASYDSRARFSSAPIGSTTQIPPQRIFWLSGPAGTGKSAIAQTIAEHCERHTPSSIFLFPEEHIGPRCFGPTVSNTRMATSHIHSQTTSTPRIYVKGRALRSMLNPLMSNSIRLFMKAFELLLRNEPGLRPEKGSKTFLTLIENELASRRIPLRFLISSRPEPHIQETFNMNNMKRNYACPRVGRKHLEPNGDIRKYLEDEFSRIFTGRRISFSLPEADIINRLVSEASGQFIYASTIIKYVDNQDRNIQKQLEIILKHRRANPISPYTPLDQLYIQILSQQQNVRLLRDVFVLVIALGRVDVEFVCRRLRVRKEDLEPGLRRMHSILNISDVAIEAYHLSLRDFFQDKERAGKYYIHPVRVTLVRLPWSIDRFKTKHGGKILIAGGLMCSPVGMLLILGVMGTKGTLAGAVLLIAVPVTVLLFLVARTWRNGEWASDQGVWKRNTDPAV